MAEPTAISNVERRTRLARRHAIHPQHRLTDPLDPAHVSYVFDTNGNAGPTAWWDGRIVGGWVQDSDGVVQVVTLPGEDVGVEAREALDAEAARLTEWLNRDVITNVDTAQLQKRLLLP